MARVLVGIPTFNRPELVLETIDSVRRQTFTDIRVVVSDNCSDQKSADTVRAHVEQLGDRRVSFVRQPVNAGEYGQGWYFYDEARDCDFLMVLHDDDLVEPGYIAEGVEALDSEAEAHVFVGNPTIIDSTGHALPRATADYLRKHGRTDRAEGIYDVCTQHMMHGFTPISGTLLRMSALRNSGFVDQDCHGNFPFEFNLFLRLGDLGTKGWFAPRPLLRVRYHDESFRGTLDIYKQPHMVRTMLKLLERRQYAGAVERRRRTIMSRLRRAEALITLRQGDVAGCRRTLRTALKANFGARSAGVAALAWTCPGLLRSVLPPLAPRDVPPPPIRGATR